MTDLTYDDVQRSAEAELAQAPGPTWRQEQREAERETRVDERHSDTVTDERRRPHETWPGAA